MIVTQPKFNWHLEVSSKCSLACPRCPRTEKPGMYKVTELDTKFIKNVFTKEILDQTLSILFCGGQGDPVYCKDLLSIIRYIKKSNPIINVKIITNGSYKTKQWWEELAEILNEHDSVIFSVDGWDQESNNKYRVNSNFESIILGINTLSKNNQKINIIWSTIVFAFNENDLERIQKTAEHNGATHFQIVQSSLFGSKVSSYNDPELGYDPLEPNYKGTFWHSDRGLLVNLKEKSISKTTLDLQEKIKKEYESKHNLFKDLDILPGCLLNERGLYIDAEGILYPCSWISHPFGERSNGKRTIKWKDSLFVKYKDNFNLHNHSLDSILNSSSWNKLYNSFFDSKKHFIECTKKCSKAATLQRLEKTIQRSLYNKENKPTDNLKKYNG